MNTKITLCTAFLFAAFCGSAQPVINSTITFPAVGTVDSVGVASATVPPGAGGAGLTWNFGSLSFAYNMKLTIVDPSTTSFYSTFPSSNFGFKLETTTVVGYNYIRKSAAGLEDLATGYNGTGTGTDYSPNPRLNAPFPFNYNDVAIDTNVTTASSTEVDALKYDAYGTLVLPGHTYTNVVRILATENATHYHYRWYTTSPFMLVLDYSSSANNYTYIAPASAPASVGQPGTQVPAVQLLPNPCSESCLLSLSGINQFDNAAITLVDVTGRVARQVPVTGARTEIRTNGLTSGLYIYNVQNAGTVIATGRIVIE